MSSQTKGILYAITTGLCWSVLAIGLKYALHFISTGTIVWVRMFFAFIFICIFYLAHSPQTFRKVFWRPPLKILGAGLFLACNYYGFLKGLELTSASNAQIMIQIGPLALFIVGVFYFSEKIRMVQWIGLFLAIVGFALFNWDQLQVSLQNTSYYLVGNLWLLFASLTWASYATLQKIQLSRNWTPQETNLLIYAICFVVLTFTANPRELIHLNLWQWTVLALLGLNTFVAYGAFAEAMHLIPASVVTLIIGVNPLCTIFLVGLISHYGWNFISPEPIMWRGYLGAFLVISGLTLAISLRQRRNLALVKE